MCHFNPWKVFLGKTLGKFVTPRFLYDEVVLGVPERHEVWACTDLGAYRKPLPDLRGLTGAVIMEDRFPEFFLSYKKFEPGQDSTLNRHGPNREFRTHEDLRALVRELKDRGLKVVIGFWNHLGWRFQFLRKPQWFSEHPELSRVPQSSDIDPFVTLVREGVPYTAYIGMQYQKLAEDFGFSGLFLGDGFSGYRSITNPKLFRDKEGTRLQWQEFYRTVSDAVHQKNGLLFAYDCMGFSYEEAALHGADYRLFADAGLDYLVFQSYPQAWGEYWLWRYRDSFNLVETTKRLASVRSALRGTRTKLLYTLELGDRVEGWQARPEKTKQQIETHDSLSDGRFLVWANDLFARRAERRLRSDPFDKTRVFDSEVFDPEASDRRDLAPRESKT